MEREKVLVNQWLDFYNLERKINRELEECLKNGAHSITLNEFYVLHILNETSGNKLRMTDLSEQIGLSLSATSRLLARFENSCKVIERTLCEDDKRGVQIKLTDSGKDILKNSYEKVVTVISKYEKKIFK